MKERYRSFYLGSLLVVLAASAYPIYMGITASAAYIKNGVLSVEQYPKYIIPYTPLCFVLILCVALMPIAYKLLKKFTFLVVSSVATVLFLIVERLFERMVIDNNGTLTVVESYQLYMCAYTPDAQRTMELYYELTNPLYRLHYYMIAIVILLACLYIAVGATRLICEDLKQRKKPLILQIVLTLFFVELCIFACFTSFYRQPVEIQPAISAVLTSLFFIVLGLTAASILEGFLFQKRPIFSLFLPALVASLVTALMYYFEYLMLGNNLYRFGRGWFFEPLGSFALAPFDIGVILLSGTLCYLMMRLLNRKPKLQ